MRTLPQRSASPSAQPGADSPVVAIALKALARLGIPLNGHDASGPHLVEPKHKSAHRGGWPSRVKVGDRFGRLVVVAFAGRDRHGESLWKCRCDCANEKIIRGANLTCRTKTPTRSCGCLRHEMNVALGRRRRTHGHCGADHTTKTSEYRSWCAMIQRCTNPKVNGYARYGGRGIKVCERWLHSFPNFLADMGRKPTPAHSIHRINPAGDYGKFAADGTLQCVWATPKEQAQRRNQRPYQVTRRNETGFRGVRKVYRKYQATISVDGAPKYLGMFATAEEAARAYDAAARELRAGTVIRVNFPRGDELPARNAETAA